MYVQPYIFFDGKAEEALNFYRQALDAKLLVLLRYKDNPEAQAGTQTPGNEEKVMHMSWQVGDTTLMGSDGHCLGKPNFQGFALTVNVASPAEAECVFSALSAGGQVQMPLSKTFFSSAFGMVADKFGVSWMVIVPAQ